MNTNVWTVLAALGILLGCQPAQMRVPPALASLDAMPVEGANPRRWNTPIAFGPWRTSQAREGMKWDFALPLLGITASYSTQPYRMVVTGGDYLVQAECVSRAGSLARKGLGVDPTFGHLPALACGFQGEGEGTLRLRNTALNEARGRVEFGATAWGLFSVNRFAGSAVPSGEALGYEVRDGEKAIAAVETINHGRVWIDQALPARDQARVAAVITALLMHVPVGDD